MKTWTPVTGALAAAAVLAIAGCGGSGNDSGGDASPATGGKARKGGVLRIGSTDAITSFNPYNVLSLQTGTALSMVYPSLIQLDYDKEKGFTPAPDFATSWKVSSDGKQITFKVRPGAKWSDGKPLTAEDAAWTVATTAKFKDGPTGQLISQVEGVKGAEAPDPSTVVVTYDKARSNAMMLLAAGMPILPKHIWEQYSEGNGRGLKTFRPDGEPGGLVSAGPYRLKEYKRRGTTAYIADPGFYGPKSNAEAVSLTFYTNADSMVADLIRGRLDVAESIPTSAVRAVQRQSSIALKSNLSGMQADLFFNSNPRKPKNLELLDPRVKSALVSCVDREQIRDVVFQGHSEMTETLVGTLGGEFQNTELPARKHDCAAANRALDDLGYDRGSDGIRVVPAKGGQPEHAMSYEIVSQASPGEYNVDRVAAILRKGWEQIGVKAVQKPVGDETATWTHLTGGNCDPETSKGYTSWDMDLAISVAEVDPISTLSGELKDSWCAWNFTGFDNPEYDKLYERAASELDKEKRKRILWDMQKLHYDFVAALPLAEMKSFNAFSKKWTGFIPPEAAIYTKLYYTAPYLAG